MEHVYGHCCTSPRLREPSGTFMDPQMVPEIDPPRLIFEDPYRLTALQGPSMVEFLTLIRLCKKGVPILKRLNA